jgi:peptide/nickel transport system ATP-binding protein
MNDDARLKPRAASSDGPRAASSDGPRAASSDRPRAAASDALLSIEHLTTVFDTRAGAAAAVDDVSFEIRSGETLGLVGESGSGKSVTALSIMRLVQPPGRIASGGIRFQGRDLLALSEPEMREVRGARIALIFQEPMTALNPVFTIGDQLGETLRVHGRISKREARARSIALLDAVKIPNGAARIDDYAHQLSGGMRQRVLIAMAIACKPSLVIADEPTTALDVTIQAQILELLREMKDTFNLSLLLITHDLGIIAETADRVAVMYAGRIVEEAPVGAIFRDPQHPYTRGLLASLPSGVPGERLRAIDGSVPMLGQLPAGCAFNPRCPDRFDPCQSAPPPDYSVGGGHSAKCYLHDPATSHQPPAANHQPPATS